MLRSTRQGAQITSVAKISQANSSTDCFSRYLKPFETWDIFSPQGVLFVVRGQCFVHFVWASAVALPDGVKTCTLPVSWLTLFYITSCQVTCLVDHHIHPPQSEKSAMEKNIDVVVLWCLSFVQKKDRILLFIISFCTLIDHVRSYFVKIFVNLYEYYDPFGPVCLL